MSNLVPPHGGKLLPLLVDFSEQEESIKEDKILPKIRLSSREVSDLIMLAPVLSVPLRASLRRKTTKALSAICI